MDCKEQQPVNAWVPIFFKPSFNTITLKYPYCLNLLSGISSRTLSDKLRFLVEENLVIRQVDDGPPVRVDYILSEHGVTCGRLLSPLVAHLKICNGSLKSN